MKGQRAINITKSVAAIFQNKPEGARTVLSWTKAWDDWGPLGSKKAPVPFIASNISHQEAAP